VSVFTFQSTAIIFTLYLSKGVRQLLEPALKAKRLIKGEAYLTVSALNLICETITFPFVIHIKTLAVIYVTLIFFMLMRCDRL
jgi:hypothetical protein